MEPMAEPDKWTCCCKRLYWKENLMKMQFDAIIIGTGQCGLALTARLSATGMRVAIIERKLFGGNA